jgi:hypothetical protein
MSAKSKKQHRKIQAPAAQVAAVAAAPVEAKPAAKNVNIPVQTTNAFGRDLMWIGITTAIVVVVLIILYYVVPR